MKEHPIIFSGAMVRAILEGRKTQTRRVVKFPFCKSVTANNIEHVGMRVVYPMPRGGYVFWSTPVGQAESDRLYGEDNNGLRCPYGEPGDRLWVRETWARVCQNEWHEGVYECESGCNSILEYRADSGNPFPGDWPAEEARGNPDVGKWHPSIHMPRSASRIKLEIVKVRVERVADIALADVVAEGIPLQPARDRDETRGDYMRLWDSLNAKRGYPWSNNPWVWVIEFRRVTDGA